MINLPWGVYVDAKTYHEIVCSGCCIIVASYAVGCSIDMSMSDGAIDSLSHELIPDSTVHERLDPPPSGQYYIYSRECASAKFFEKQLHSAMGCPVRIR